MDNLEIWNQVCTTNPAHTKGFSRGGGFKGTAINVVHQIHKATTMWGPMGGKWGLDVVKEEMLQGAPLVVDGAVVGHELIHCIRVELRHPHGVVPAFGQTTFVGKNKNGLFTDEEAPKKSLTDALSKALSWLGFSADVHTGRYDDNKYVNDLRQEFAANGDSAGTEAREDGLGPASTAGDETDAEITAQFNAARSVPDLVKVMNSLSGDQRKAATQYFNQRMNELKKAA